MSPRSAARDLRIRPQLLRNIGFNLAARTAVGLLMLVTIPVLIHRLGTASFGIYAISVSLTEVTALFDLGMSAAFVTQLSSALRDEDNVRVKLIVRTALSIFLALGLLAAAAVASAAPWLLMSVLHVPVQRFAEAHSALLLTAAGLGINLFVSPLDAIPIALERYDIVAMRLSGISVLASSATLLYSIMGGSLVGLVLINVLASAIALIVFYTIAAKLLTDVELVPGLSIAVLKRMLGFSAFKFAGTASSAVMFRFDQLALGSLQGVSATGLYSVPATIVPRVLSLFASFAAPVYPRVAAMRPGSTLLASLYIRTSRMVALIAFPMVAILAFMPHALLSVWISGPEGRVVADAVAPTLRWMALALAIQAVAAVPGIYCEASGRPWINNSFAVVSLFIHVPIFFLLVAHFGLEGAGITLLVNSLLQTIPFIIITTRNVARVPLAQFVVEALLRPAIAAITPALIAVVGGRYATTRLRVTLILVAAVSGYVLSVALVRALTKNDLTSLRAAVFDGTKPGRNRQDNG